MAQPQQPDARYNLEPVDGDPFAGSDADIAFVAPSGAPGSFSDANAQLALTEDHKQQAWVSKQLEQAAQAQANPVSPQRALLQGLDPRVSDEQWSQDLRDSLEKEGASSGTSAVAKGLGVVEREISRLLGAPSEALELGRQSEVTRQAAQLLPAGELAEMRGAQAWQSLGLALGLAGGATPFAEPGALGIFGGRLAEGARGDQLAAAQLKLAAGHDPAGVWQQHGWYRDVDGQWKHEISDAGASMHPGATPEGLPPGQEYVLGDALHHPAFFAAYPQAKDWGLGFGVSGDTRGLFTQPSGMQPTIHLNPALSSADQLSTLLHEAQHGVQDIEGFGRGAAVPTLQPEEEAFVRGLVPEYQRLRQLSAPTAEDAARFQALHSLFSQVDQFHSAAYDRYRSAAGEVEARNVQERQRLSPAQAADLHPDWTADTDPAARRVAFQVEGGPMAAPQPPQPLLASGWHPAAAEVLQREHDFLTPQLPGGDGVLAGLQRALDEGPGHEAQLHELHHPAVAAAQQAQAMHAPAELSEHLQQVVQQLHASREEVSRDGETFWQAPEPEAPYSRDDVDALRRHGYHFLEDHSTAPPQRSWAWSKELPGQEGAEPESQAPETAPQLPTNDPEYTRHLGQLLGGSGVSHAELLQGLFGGRLHPDSLQSMHLGQGLLNFTGLLRGDGGSVLGSLERTFNVPERSVEHEFFDLRDAEQGKGVARGLLRQQVELYSRLGLDKVGLFANIDVGGYAWGKYGFTPSQRAWDGLRKGLQLPEGLPEDVAGEARKLLRSSDPRSLWHLADMTYPSEEGPLGKALLLGSKWRGELRLSDPEAMERFHAYTKE